MTWHYVVFGLFAVSALVVAVLHLANGQAAYDFAKTVETDPFAKAAACSSLNVSDCPSITWTPTATERSSVDSVNPPVPSPGNLGGQSVTRLPTTPAGLSLQNSSRVSLIDLSTLIWPAWPPADDVDAFESHFRSIDAIDDLKKLGGRQPSSPIITGDGFLMAADMECARSCDAAHATAWATANPGAAVVVFIAGEAQTFISRMLPRLRELSVPFVLVGHNSDSSMPHGAAQVGLLDEPLLLAWFTQNAVLRHPRVHPLPIGYENRVSAVPMPFSAVCFCLTIPLLVPSHTRNRSTTNMGDSLKPFLPAGVQHRSNRHSVTCLQPFARKQAVACACRS